MLAAARFTTSLFLPALFFFFGGCDPASERTKTPSTPKQTILQNLVKDPIDRAQAVKDTSDLRNRKLQGELHLEE